MNVVLLADGPVLPWQERLERAQQPVGGMWRVVGKAGVVRWERVGPGGADPWETPSAWDMGVVVLEQRRQDLLPFVLSSAPKIPMLLLTPKPVNAQQQAARKPSVKVVCDARQAAQPEVLAELLVMVRQVYFGLVVIGTNTNRGDRRRQAIGSRYVYGA